MESLGPQCTQAKTAYESCFNTWYTNKFLKGKVDNECDELFQDYRRCILVSWLQPCCACSARSAHGHWQGVLEEKKINLEDLKFDESLFNEKK
jgi:hypothetical protein